MNKLRLNQIEGYLESSNSFVAFDAHKKTNFIEFAAKFMAERKEVPEISELCDLVGISRRTFQRHYTVDEEFKSQWQELMLRAQDILVGVMFNRAKTPGGYMDRITWLRRHFPEDWNPEFKVKQEVNNTAMVSLVRIAESDYKDS